MAAVAADITLPVAEPFDVADPGAASAATTALEVVAATVAVAAATVALADPRLVASRVFDHRLAAAIIAAAAAAAATAAATAAPTVITTNPQSSSALCSRAARRGPVVECTRRVHLHSAAVLPKYSPAAHCGCRVHLHHAASLPEYVRMRHKLADMGFICTLQTFSPRG